ncbi:metalloregulator ArsR/SmtB family transcription factor [Corynebacterium breve]|uniref:Metalloregulator ArsR/SmtB family transcription factor n=1 Tax=Corynebacterium breve TaxID=3049799 RepID=A0ABY8VFV9_9CORY|nr:metalloregulator ArsR/SmtB family transcription factor [Corynebacterium breve]WIM68529.1 metalloregulator ArsR/SmtB family transcription factor [Corynebacterium breve]
MNADTKKQALSAELVDATVQTLGLLANETRLRLLWELRGRELTVNDLAERVDKPGPAVSQHLAKLRLAGLVESRREAQFIFYRNVNEHVERLVTDAVYNAEHLLYPEPAHHKYTGGQQ